MKVGLKPAIGESVGEELALVAIIIMTYTQRE